MNWAQIPLQYNIPLVQLSINVLAHQSLTYEFWTFQPVVLVFLSKIKTKRKTNCNRMINPGGGRVLWLKIKPYWIEKTCFSSKLCLLLALSFIILGWLLSVSLSLSLSLPPSLSLSLSLSLPPSPPLSLCLSLSSLSLSLSLSLSSLLYRCLASSSLKAAHAQSLAMSVRRWVTDECITAWTCLRKVSTRAMAPTGKRGCKQSVCTDSLIFFPSRFRESSDGFGTRTEWIVPSDRSERVYAVGAGPRLGAVYT